MNVMCYLDDIYVYLRARANNAIPGGRPPTHEDKPEAAKAGRNQLHGYQMTAWEVTDSVRSEMFCSVEERNRSIR